MSVISRKEVQSKPLSPRLRRAGRETLPPFRTRGMRVCRLAILSGICFPVGLLCVTRSMTPADCSRVCGAFLDGLKGPASLPLFILRSGLWLLPCLLLLMLGGISCAAGMISSFVLSLQSLCEGAAAGCLLCVQGGGSRLLVSLYLVRCLCLLGLRLSFSLCCMETGESLADPALQLSPGARGLSPLMKGFLRAAVRTLLSGISVQTAFSLLLLLLR